MFDLGLVQGNEFSVADVHWLDEDRLRTWMQTLNVRHRDSGEERTVEVDAAVVEVSPEEVERFAFKPFGLDQVLPGTIGENLLTVVLGYPSDTYDRSRIGDGVVKAVFLSFGTAGAPAADWSDLWLPGIHQVVRWPGTETERWDSTGVVVKAKLPPPGGISGCALWAMTQRKGEIFNPILDSAFAGIQYGHLGEVLVGCDASLLISMIAHAFPDTVPVLRKHGFRDLVGLFTLAQ